MAIWPSSTKASTSNVDSGSDKPRLARSDIKDNIDNTNSIIDMFDLATPSDKDTLVYNSTNARFETQAAVFQEAILQIGTAVSSAGAPYPQIDVASITSDPQGITSLSSGQFTLDVGTYLIWCWTAGGSNNPGASVRSGGSFTLVDPDGDNGGKQAVISSNGTVLDGLMFFDQLIVSGSSNTFYVAHSAAFAPGITSGNISNRSYLRIAKVA